RQHALTHLNEQASSLHQSLSQGKERLSIHYKQYGCSSPCSDLGTLLALFQRYRSHELQTGVTSRGPHRDDLQFLINDRESRSFASEGQQRLATLSLRLAEWHHLGQ